MVTHAISAAEKSGAFAKIHVSTDSTEIFDVATTYKHRPDFMRPDSLAGDHASMMEVVRYVVEEYEKKGETFDTIALIYATSPLIDPQDLAKACNAFEKGNKDIAVLAVTPFPAPIEQAFRMKDDGSLFPDNEKALATRTQDLQKAYYDAGMFAVYAPAYIKKQQSSGDFMAFRGYVVPEFRVTDIDWPEDWERAEKLYRAVNG